MRLLKDPAWVIDLVTENSAVEYLRRILAAFSLGETVCARVTLKCSAQERVHFRKRDTARWASIYRARESERKDGLFRDPFARRLAGERGEQMAKAPVFLDELRFALAA